MCKHTDELTLSWHKVELIQQKQIYPYVCQWKAISSPCFALSFDISNTPNES